MYYRPRTPKKPRDNGTAPRILLKFVALYVAVGALLRVALILNPLTSLAGVGVAARLKIFVCGAVNDLCVGTLMLAPLVMLLVSTGRRRFEPPLRYICLGALCLLTLWLGVGAAALEEFNKGLQRVLFWVSVWWLLSFALRSFAPGVRRGWDCFWITLTIGIYTAVAIGNAVSEWIFWDEFGVRYNFIAVDYLVYTSEVIGNIRQSYPMGWIISALVVVSAALTYALYRREIAAIPSLAGKGWRARVSGLYVLAAGASLVCLPLMLRMQNEPNKYADELQANGVYSFYQAFRSNELDYSRFYHTLPAESLADMRAAAPDAPDSLRALLPSGCNVVVITMESMSADYMARFGGEDSLTPCLDSLYGRSLAFTNLFAAGNRTVRGLEALMLSRPPSPGESIIKRPDNTGYPAVTDPLADEGYTKMFFYGGDSYFDNMESFYTGLGFEICDKKIFEPSEVEFATVWGICDEDVYLKMIDVIDQQQRESGGAPFFAQMMTTSNHRPYTYPEGRISIPPSAKSRKGGVMYADYALSRFFAKAAETEWFGRTVFVVCADHCASSAGKVDLPLEAYHIPALVYAPWCLQPAEVSKVCSQIDLLPTVFALMGMPHDHRLYGRDILSPAYTERAYMATYQDLGYLARDTLTVLSPGEKVQQYRVEASDGNPYGLRAIDPEPSSQALIEAVSSYQ